MAVNKINDAINALDWELVLQTPRGQVVRVCAATEPEWNAFLESENQEFKSTHMEWLDGAICVVEVPSSERAVISVVLAELLAWAAYVGGYSHCLGASGATYVSTLLRYEPDASFGPMPEMERLGARLPQGFRDWGEYHTLKVEVGFTRTWGDASGQLDWKANQWAAFPGVQYVLCVAVTADLASASYKLHTVTSQGESLPPQEPTPIVAPTTVVPLDAHRLLGLPHANDLPPNFPNPFPIDLFAVLVEARSRRGNRHT